MGKCFHISYSLAVHPLLTAQAFYSRVTKTGKCWNWTGAKSKRSGYGWFKREGAHRASWLIHRGTIPQSMDVLHTCDNRLCVNPDHLFLGTQLDNMRDMDSKGRRRTVTTTGENHWSARLTKDDIPVILARRRAGEFFKTIAADYGVGYTAIQAICNGRNWKSVTASQG